MAKSPRKNVAAKSARPSKAPGKTILSKSNPRKPQRRFSLIDSDSSELSEFESEEEEPTVDSYARKFQAIQSDSEDEDDNESDSHEELWKSHSNQVVNTSSEDDDDDDDDDDSSSSDDDEDYVKLTAERKKKALEHYRSSSPFKAPSPSKAKKHDVNFSFDWNNGDHQLKIQDEEEDVGEELSGMISPLKKEIPISEEPLGLINIEDSESDEDIDKDELLRTLAQESDGLDDGIDTGEDDYNLLQEEANNILQDYSSGDLQFSNQTTPRNSIVEEMVKKYKQEQLDQDEVLQFVSDDEYDDDDDDDEYDDDAFVIPFFDDSTFKDKLLYTSEGAINSTQKKKDIDSDDDSYLWNYFFSGGENSEDEDGQGEDMSDDEATDEDTTLPPPSSRKRVGAKAQELLSSSSIIARPPALGTWSTDSKPFGIIDGLSTRSLLPTPSKSINDLPLTPMNNSASNGNVEEFTLDELLNMSELEDDDNEQILDHEQWLEVTSSNRKVPLSAFRNKGVMNDDIHLNATRRFSQSVAGSKIKSKKLRNEITMTPVRSLAKRPDALQQQQRKRRGSKMRRRQSVAEAAGEGLRVTRSGLFSEDTLTNVEEFLSGLGNEAELSLLFREVQ